jgi:hypothetical protein
VGRNLFAPITTEELKSALLDMAKEKSPRQDGLAVEFYVLLWDTIGVKFTKMINLSIQKGHLLRRMTCGLLKGGSRDSLHNWWSILLLNVSYKIFAKLLQKRLQLMLSRLFWKINPHSSH